MSEIRGNNNNTNGSSQWYHPLSNMIEIFGNTRGYSVSSGSSTGGSLITEIYQTFGKYISQEKEIFDEQTFLQLFNPIKKALHNKQYGNQVVKIEETLIGIEVAISPKSGHA